MIRCRNSALCALTVAQIALNGCGADPSVEPANAEHPGNAEEPACVTGQLASGGDAGGASTSADGPAMGLMTSLPLNFALGADLSDFASGRARPPWQAAVLSRCNTVVPLDNLTPVEGFGSAIPAANPLEDLDFLAIIQPRGLSPADNVVLDDWVRAGGHLLLALDPILTGEYDLPLGDPRRPSVVALIPPVAARWGMEVTFDDAQDFEPVQTSIGDAHIPTLLSGIVTVTGGRCVQNAPHPVQKCEIGKGSVTLIADAAVFEDQQLAGPDGAAIQALLTFAFDR